MALETIVKIPPLKTGLEFLASSHFQIGNEPKWLSKSDCLAYTSTFKHDYVPVNGKKSQLAKIPPPAGIMHKDGSIREVCSVARKQFVPKGLNERIQACNALTKTNFKMDKDDRIETFETIHDIYYKKPDSAQQNVVKKNFSHKMESHIPQGLLFLCFFEAAYGRFFGILFFKLSGKFQEILLSNSFEKCIQALACHFICSQVCSLFFLLRF